MRLLPLLLALLGLALAAVPTGAADQFKPDPGFTRLDNGKDLNNWMGDRNSWTVNKDGVICRSPDTPASKTSKAIYSQKRHDDNAIIRLEFSAATGSRGAVLIHGKEFPVGDYQKMGQRDYAQAAKAAGQYNELEFDITRGQATVKLNGKTVEKSWQSGRDNNKGVGLLRDSGEIEFRHLQQKDKK